MVADVKVQGERPLRLKGWVAWGCDVPLANLSGAVAARAVEYALTEWNLPVTSWIPLARRASRAWCCREQRSELILADRAKAQQHTLSVCVR